MALIEKRLEELGILLPPAPEPKYTYVPCTRTGNLIYLSGQICWDNNGKMIHQGKLGRDLTIEQGQEAARQTILNCIAVLKAELGDLDRVVRFVKLLGFVNSAPGFVDHPLVINGGSNLLVEIFGEAGRHARSAIGTSELPLNTPVEIEAIVEFRD